MEQEAYVESSSTGRSGLGKIFQYCILCLVFLIPVAFLPSPSIALYPGKLAVLASVLVIFIGVFLASILSSGLVLFPKTRFLVFAALFPAISILSSLFSGAITKSFAGNVFDFGTSGSFVVIFSFLFLALFAVRNEISLATKTIFVFLGSCFVLVLHLILRIIGPLILPGEVLARIPNFLAGGAVDTAIFLGAGVIASLCLLSMFRLSNKISYAIYVLMALSVIYVGAVGFLPSIIALGLFALMYFVYGLSWSIGSGNREVRSKIPSLIVLAISVVFLISGNSLSAYLSNLLKINMVEVRPTHQATMSLVGEAWKINPLLGVGPNMFKELWDMKHPVDVNLSQFWGADFNFGSGFVPSVAATTGVLGIAVFLGFLIFYGLSGFKAIFSFAVEDSDSRSVATVSFFSSMFIWVMSFVYVPSISVMAIALVLSGVFAATLVPLGIAPSANFNIFKNPKLNFAAVFLIVVCLISSVAFGYFIWERVVSNLVFQRGSASNAAKIVSTDMYWRGVSENAVAKLASVLASIPVSGQITESQRVSIQEAVSEAVEGSRRAIGWNPKNYQNWFALGRVYEILASNGIEGAFESARSAYVEAQARAPLNPAIPLALGRLDAMSGNTTLAKENIAKAITLKNNYTDAYFTLAQIEAAGNNIKGAIQSVEAATFVDPQNATLYFQLGLLKYNSADYAGSVSAFERAVSLVPDYANARYFLGLSFYRLGEIGKAISQFESIEVTNPENLEVKLILSNLRSGRSPFANTTSPLDDKPEKRPEPPIEEN